MGANQARYSTASAFFPPVPPAVLPGAAFVLLGAAFFLSFYFSTCVSSLTSLGSSRFSLREPAVILVGSLAAGFGVVALFAAIGVSV